ncbi:uncharacterized protein LOC127130898 [Lathyrus oleraceus]|uniref:uncharacterized protein LOC127130898 n=1 Tax=Pisum sativum TaxID=3888 RepID=UPI0021D0FB7B|nr:uncharacterized protein LOC127130898 [Pisum sativum]
MLYTDVEDGVLNTLVHLYDSPYRCFTFPDYKPAPTLEEYSYYICLLVSYQTPFNGSEEIPKSRVIVEAVHLRKWEIDANPVTKGGILGLPTKLLMEKVTTLSNARSMVSFEVILTLLIYGIILFPNIDNFEEINVICISLIRNPVPTLLADTYYSIHHKMEKNGGTLTCCAPLLYKWFISHFPQSSLFKDNKKCSRWSQRTVSLTNADVTWYSRVYDDVKIIDNYGEFPNLHLLGTKGGINYNPILARRQLRYAMKDKPNNIILEGLFIQEGVDSNKLKEKIVHT